MRMIQDRMRLVLGLVAGAALVADASAQCGHADLYEDNDVCAAAVVLTPGTYTGLTCQGPSDPGGNDPDFFRITIPAGDQLVVDVLHTSSETEDIHLYLYDALSPGCGSQSTYLTHSNSTSDNDSVLWANTTNANIDVIIEVTAYLGVTSVVCDVYDLVLTISPDPCQTPLDDSFEPNDTCAAPTPISAGSHASLFVSTTDEDFYSITVPAGHEVIVDQTYASPVVEYWLRLYSDAACTTLAGLPARGGGPNQVIGRNTTGATQDFYMRVSVAQEVCGNYDLNIIVQPDQCQLVPDDVFEENDTCATAVALPSGASTGLFVAAADPDHFVINIPAGEELLIDQSYNVSQADLRILLYNDPSCSNLVAASGWGNGLNQLSYSNATGASANYYLSTQVIEGACTNYDLFVSLQADPCLAPGLDDSFEDNDSCASSASLSPGMHTGLHLSKTDLDYFKVTVPAGQVVTVDQTYNPSTELILRLYSSSACSSPEASASFGGGLNSAWWLNDTGAPRAVFIKCDIPLSGADCADYDLSISLSPNPCQDPLFDDGFEDNESCATAYPIVSQNYTGLFVSKTDPDIYTFNLGPGGTADISVNHAASFGDIDLHLVDEPAGICNFSFPYLDSAETGDDVELISWTNNTGSTVTYYMRVSIWSLSTGDCNSYDMSVTLVGSQIASPICAGDSTFDAGAGPVSCPCNNDSTPGSGEGCLNSAAHGATISATGSNLIGNDDMVFHLAQARPNQVSILVQGETLIGLPFKDGLLCMGNPTKRVEAITIDAAGAGSTTSSIVTEGDIPGPGVTRYYQFWYRDPASTVCGTGSNFSSGLRVNWI